MSHFIVSSGHRKNRYVARTREEAVSIGQEHANRSRVTWHVEYFGHDGLREFCCEVRPEPKQGKVATRIQDRMKSLIDSGMTIEEAAHAITTENMARL